MGCCATTRKDEESPNVPVTISSKVRLHYFDFYGRAEVIRIALTLAEVQFEDVRYSPSTWQAAVQSFPFNQLPMLEISGRQLTCSLSILRYICQTYGFYPDSTDHQLTYKCESICEYLDEIRVKFLMCLKEGGVAQNKAYKEVRSVLETISTFLTPDQSYLIGNKISMADLLVVNFLWDNFLSAIKEPVHGVKVSPELRKYVFGILELHPGIKVYLDSRPVRPA